jgi:hypothetical protein
MSQANFNPNLHSRSGVPATPLTSPQIIQGPDCVAILLPNGLWNEALQEQAQSANIRSDPRAVAELIASERSQPSTNQGTATPARPVLQPDRRDAIPLIYCNRTRHIIALVGFVVSSATILGVQMAAIADLVPGFQSLPIYLNSEEPRGPVDKIGNIAILGFTGIGVIFLIACFAPLGISEYD